LQNEPQVAEFEALCTVMYTAVSNSTTAGSFIKVLV